MMKSPINAVKTWIADPDLPPMAIKAFIVAVAAAALVVPLAIVAVPYIDFFNDMAMQYKVKPQMVWKYEDGLPVAFDRPFPREVVPREEYPYPFTNNDPKLRDQAVAWLMRTDPPPPSEFRAPKMTMELLKRGDKVFHDICIVCHGPYAFGNGTVTRLGFPAPPSLHTRDARTFPVERIFHVITLGQNVMPSYAFQIPVEDRWAAAGYIKALQRAFHPGPEEEAPPPDEKLRNAPQEAPAPTSPANPANPDGGRP